MPDFTTCPKCCDQWPQRCFPTAKYKNQVPNPHIHTSFRLGNLLKPKGGSRNDVISKKKHDINRLNSCGFRFCDFETEVVPGSKTKGIHITELKQKIRSDWTHWWGFVEQTSQWFSPDLGLRPKYGSRNYFQWVASLSQINISVLKRYKKNFNGMRGNGGNRDFSGGLLHSCTFCPQPPGGNRYVFIQLDIELGCSKLSVGRGFGLPWVQHEAAVVFWTQKLMISPFVYNAVFSNQSVLQVTWSNGNSCDWSIQIMSSDQDKQSRWYKFRAVSKTKMGDTFTS